MALIVAGWRSCATRRWPSCSRSAQSSCSRSAPSSSTGAPAARHRPGVSPPTSPATVAGRGDRWTPGATAAGLRRVDEHAWAPGTVWLSASTSWPSRRPRPVRGADRALRGRRPEGQDVRSDPQRRDRAGTARTRCGRFPTSRSCNRSDDRPPDRRLSARDAARSCQGRRCAGGRAVERNVPARARRDRRPARRSRATVEKIEELEPAAFPSLRSAWLERQGRAGP